MALVKRAEPHAIARTSDGFQLRSPRRSWDQRDSDVTALHLTRGLLGYRLELRTHKANHVVRGLNTREATIFFNTAKCQWLASLRNQLDEWERNNRESLNFLHSTHAPTRYIRHTQLARHRLALSSASAQLPVNVPSELAEHSLCAQIPLLRQFLNAPIPLVQSANATYVKEEMARSKKLFDAIEAHPLSDEQQCAVVTDEDHNLVVAAAGSGKTAVIVAKLAHLISQGDVHPSHILLLAFNRAARDEIHERIATKLPEDAAKDVTVMTFHGLGYAILGAASQRKPALAKHAGDAPTAARHVRNIIDALCADSVFERALFEWFASHLHQYKSEFEFDSLGGYYKYLEENDIVTLKGERVRSYEELLIANFLFSRGVEYQYEANYEVDTADAEHRRYQPDFFLPHHGIYIEHFGIDRHGQTAPFVNAAQYQQEMAWKRTLHKTHGTDLVETYSYQHREGELLASLRNSLAERGVTFSPVSAKEQLDTLKQSKTYDRFSELITIFLKHFKSNDLDRKSLVERAKAYSDTEHANAFTDIFVPVYEEYQSILTKANELDFEDMICGAADLVKSSAYQSPYQYILVDEFQDVSVGRANLLKALCEQHIDNQLFAVGDDWQSIYRFAGSDISVMRNFASFFGATAKSTLATTYRYNQELADASGRFIEANPAQLKKNVKGLRRRNAPAVYIARSSEGFPNLLDECLRRIQQESDPADVLLLGRYRHNRPKNWSALQDAFPRLSLRYQTAHSAKGLEADYVVVIELSAGTYGFPSEIEDDPLLSLVLAADEPYAHAEERRLFYVALTRARHATFLVAPNARCSAFVEELESGKYLVEVFGDEMASRVRCPACSTGLLSVREGEHGSFVGCEHYPRCTYAASVCPTCRHGIVKFDKNKGACNACSDEFVVCPQCAKGYLHKRVGKFGDFLGCTGYPACKYTQSTSTANSRKRESR